MAGLFNTGVDAAVVPAAAVAFSTGVDAGGNALSYLASDAHYTLSSAPTGYAGGVKVLTSAGAFPVGPWAGDSASSAWLVPAAADDDGTAPGGDYDFTTTVDVTDPTAARLSGQWAADNHAAIYLNGNSTGVTVDGFGSLNSFAVTAGFVAGANTLTFRVHNDGDSANPVGLRVQLDPPAPVALDAHYTIVSGPSGYTGATKVIPNGAYPIGPWVANTSTASWIAPAVSDGEANAPVGDYTYRTTFDLTGEGVSNLVLKGVWAADNEGVDILLNGVSMGISHFGNNPGSGVEGFTWTSSFSLDHGFTAGTNTLDFVVCNDQFSPTDTSANPTGLRVDGLTLDLKNHPPEVTPKTYSVQEHCANGTEVGSVVASDPDAGQTLNYDITGGNLVPRPD